MDEYFSLCELVRVLRAELDNVMTGFQNIVTYFMTEIEKSTGKKAK